MAAAECSSAATSAIQTSTTIDRTSEEEQDESEEELGGGGTSRKARPEPLDITAAQNANSTGGPITPNSATPKTPRPKKYDTGKKIGHRRVDIEGQITYKKIQTTQIMGSIQLGISHAVGGLASKPERDVLMQDFAVVETTAFPNQGSSCTPAHHYTDFKFKTYAPVAFRYFRDLFSIQPDDFLLSMCMEPMRELTNPGASGSIFYVTADDEFIIKTVQHKEGEFLQKLLPGYYMNLNQNPRTLLPKFFGLYCYMFGGKNVRLIVMDNLLPSSIKIHQKYDLKGSTYKRKAAKHECKKPSPTYKDLDFMEHHPEGILLEAETYNALIKTIQRDCRVLASFKIMDYSLLVGIHNLDKAHRERIEQRREASRLAGDQSAANSAEPDGVSSATGGPGLSRSRSINRQRLVAHSTGMEAIQADSEPIDEEEDFPPGGIPARNAKGERLFLFLGIIDILQSYRLKKKLEHTWKSMLHDGDTVSVHRPGFYAQRFQDFMASTVFKKIPSPLKHSPSRKKSVTMRYRPGSLSEAADELDATGVALNFDGPSGSIGHGASKRSGASTSKAASVSQSDIPAFSTPPPTFEEALQDDDDLKINSKVRSSTDPTAPSHTLPLAALEMHGSVKSEHSTTVGITSIQMKAESLLSTHSESSSTTSSGFSSFANKTCTWTPPHSVEGSTPTHTEGTPSFTESSSSGDLGCPTTPVKSLSTVKEHSSANHSDLKSYQETEMFLLQVTEASPTGAPESACQTLKPNHGHQPQPASTFPYIVTMTTDSYSSPNDKIAVTLKSPADGKPAFKGFLLAARNEQNKALGSWKSSLGHQLSCSAITHNNNNDKTSATMTWQPPLNATSGKVTMTIAVVQNVSTFWINIPVAPDSGFSHMDASASSTNHKIIATTKNLHKMHTLRTHSPINGNPTVTIKPIKPISTKV